MTTEGVTADDMTADALLPGLREPANSVSRRAVRYWTARAAGSGALVVLAVTGAAVSSGFSVTWQTVLAVTVALTCAHAVIMPRWRFRVHRWEVTDEALYTRSGWFSVHWRIAPISRIQTIDSHRSFGERIFGLANVTATTASAAGPVRIHGLDRATADELLDRLAVATGQTPGDAT
jgi:membrane protein YdbS with pleckstrin-like domain